MGDDFILQFSSNSSNQSDQSSKIAKLEARMVGKASSTAATQSQVQVQPKSWYAAGKFCGKTESLSNSAIDSDDSDDDVSNWSVKAGFFPIYLSSFVVTERMTSCSTEWSKNEYWRRTEVFTWKLSIFVASNWFPNDMHFLLAYVESVDCKGI